MAMIEVDGTVVASAMTAEDYFAIPEGDRRYWLVDGDLVVNSPTYDHQRLVLELALRLRRWTDTAPGHGIAMISVDARVDDRNVYQPDVWWLASAHLDRLVDGRLAEAPDLAIEVISLSTGHLDRGRKLRGYERSECSELWIVDGARRSVVLHRRSSSSSADFDVHLEVGPTDVVTSPLLPGLEIDLSELFVG